MINPKTVKLNLLEQFQLSIGCYCQLLLKVKKNKVSDIVNEIAKKAIGCRNFVDGDNYVYTKEQCPIFKIPNHFKSDEDILLYVAQNYTIPESTRLGCICYNENTVILNSNHSSSDGGYYKLLTKYLTGDKVPDDSYYYIHESMNDVFENEFSSVDGNFDLKTTHINTKNIDLRNTSINAYYIPVIIPIEKLVCFRDGKCKGLTELLLSSMILSISAFNGKFVDANTYVAVDGRREILNPGWQHANIDSLVPIGAKDITENSTIGEMKQKIRENMNKQLDKKEHLRSMKAACKGTFIPNPEPIFGVSNIGLLQSGGDILDVNVGTSTYKPAAKPGSISLNSISSNGIFKGRIYISPVIMTRTDGEKLGRAVKYCLENGYEDIKIGRMVSDLINISYF